MAQISGAEIVVKALKQQGVQYMFGIIGFPVIPIGIHAQRAGLTYVNMRNEQAASYAAAAVGYLTGRPGVCLAVSGPGMIHGIAGMANAWSNCWPMILIGGANDSYQNGQGAFQEAPQIETARPYAKYAARPDSIARLPYYIEQAVRTTIYGRPGAAYLDLSGDVISGQIDEDTIKWPAKCPDPARAATAPENVDAALAALKSASNPLVIVGKGMAYAEASDDVREFLERTQLPFLPTPMGKGVVPDDHPLSVAGGRTYALQNADVIFLMGARLNWILHFGAPPRFRPDVRVVQLDISQEEIGTNVPTEVALVGDGKAITQQVNAVLKSSPWQYPSETTWWTGLQAAIEKNVSQTEAQKNDDSSPLNYYRVYRSIVDLLPKDAIIQNEGANTMDIGRTQMPNYFPKHRLDAGSFGTMGVGTGQAIAAAVVHPDKKVVNIQGDSAFGFSGMEIETMCRYRLPITNIIINNNGIGGGPGEMLPPDKIPPGAYIPNARYDKLADAFGGKGFFVTEADQLEPALKEALAHDMPTIVNIMIDPRANRKQQQFAWLTR
ncbi:MAG: thiamine pyrophosphate-binding protein [Dehalococcoidia bacterium]